MYEMKISDSAPSISGIEIRVQEEDEETLEKQEEITSATRMAEIPAYLLRRPRRLQQAEHNAEVTIANENSGGGSTEDGDFKQLKKVRERRKKERQLEEENENTEIQPQLIKPEVRKNRKSNDSNGPRPISSNRQKKFEDLRIKMFKTVIEGDEETLTRCIEDINIKIPFSDAVMTNPKNNENVLNYALSNHQFDKASLLIDKGDETLLQNAFSVSSTTKTALLQVTEANQIDLAKKIISRLKDVKKAMTANTKIEMTDQRPREFPCLHLAAYYGHTELVKFYLEQGEPYGITVDFPNKKQDTALLWATKCGHKDTVSFLLEKGADPNKGNDKGSTAFYWAIRYEHTEIVQLLLNNSHKKVDIHKERKLGLVAPIVLASAYGNHEIVKLLLKHGANKDHVITGGQTPLHHACKEGHIKVVRQLLSYKADFRRQDEKGDCAILLAARYGHVNIVRILLNLGDDPTRRNNMGHDTWHYAINSNDLSLLKTLLEYGTAPTEREFQVSKDPSGRPHFFTAAAHGHVEKIKYLFQAGHDPNDRDNSGNTFLHYAASFNQSEVIRCFQKYVSVDAQNERNETCLHISVNAGFVQCTQALLEANASTNIKNHRGENILHIAAMSKHTTPEVAKMLVDHTIKTHDWESLNAKDNFGNNALHIAAKFANPDVLWEFRYLRFKDLDEDGNTPLHEAVRKGEDSEGLETMLDIFEVMDRDGNVNEPNKKKETVLHLAVLEGYHNTIRRLVYLKADLEAQDQEGNTVLHKLITAIANDPSNTNRYLKSFEVIVDEGSRWWCSKKNLKFFDLGKNMATRLKRQALVYLMTSVKNNSNYTPLTLAYKLGVHEILSRYLMIENITLFHEGDNILFDVTNITPMTAEDLTQKYFSSNPSRKIQSDIHITGLEILMKGANKERAARILDIPPMREVEKLYNVLNAVTFTVLVILHIVYMSLFSYTGLEISKEFRENPINMTTDNSVYILTYIVVPMEPLIFLLYFLLTVISTIRRRDFSSPLSRLLPFLFYIVYSGLVIAWLVLITTQERYQDYVLALCLGLGWVYTITFTRGFKAINYFWRMILNMIVSDVRRFLIVYACVLLAFAFALHALFQISASIANTYPTFADTVFLVFNIMVGMGEIFDDNFETGMTDVGRTTGFIKVVYVVYLVLATIVLLNMLIAMMNDSYSQTLAVQKYHWRVDSVQIGVSIERLLPWLPRMFSKIQHRKIPGEDEKYEVRKYYVVLPQAQYEAKYGRLAGTEEGQQKDQLREDLMSINNKMEETEQQLNAVKSKLEEVMSMMKKKENV
ncbi:ankyrin-3-like [Saccostrea echinata]|uniref:ankyrin-3-like n=1 Tax=Saccostrea echinata TaxID=191078 RepID=UPI002A804624|nr:ankyrin-3-like [Saccostrea echinata]